MPECKGCGIGFIGAGEACAECADIKESNENDKLLEAIDYESEEENDDEFESEDDEAVYEEEYS